MIVLAFLQNQWFHRPERMEELLQGRHYKGDRELFIRTFLFFRCTTGKRLQRAFGEDWCGKIVWDEVSPRWVVMLAHAIRLIVNTW